MPPVASLFDADVTRMSQEDLVDAFASAVATGGASREDGATHGAFDEVARDVETRMARSFARETSVRNVSCQISDE